MAYIDNGDGTASSDNNWPSDYVECWREQQSNYDSGIGHWRTAND